MKIQIESDALNENDLEYAVYETFTAQGFVIEEAQYNPDNSALSVKHGKQYTIALDGEAIDLQTTTGGDGVFAELALIGLMALDHAEDFIVRIETIVDQLALSLCEECRIVKQIIA